MDMRGFSQHVPPERVKLVNVQFLALRVLPSLSYTAKDTWEQKCKICADILENVLTLAALLSCVTTPRILLVKDLRAELTRFTLIDLDVYQDEN